MTRPASKEHNRGQRQTQIGVAGRGRGVIDWSTVRRRRRGLETVIIPNCRQVSSGFHLAVRHRWVNTLERKSIIVNLYLSCGTEDNLHDAVKVFWSHSPAIPRFINTILIQNKVV